MMRRVMDGVVYKPVDVVEIRVMVSTAAAKGETP